MREHNKPFNFDLSLDTLEKQFRKLKTTLGVDRKFDFLEGENAHEAGSLLMAIHYGTDEDVKTIKDLIVKQAKTPLPNPSYLKRIKMTSKFIKMHQEKKDFHEFFGKDFQ